MPDLTASPPPPPGLFTFDTAPVASLTGLPMVAGIVAEYNPFHRGHEWMINQLRRGGVDYVVCAMSGAFVQRAEGAILPTHLRARAAIAAGADLVVRLPVGWATASAEAFAQGAVGLLSSLGCVDMIAFGAECDRLAPLEEIAQLLLSDVFPPLLKAALAGGASFAAARAAAIERLLPGSSKILAAPNNILAIEYIKALQRDVPELLRGGMAEDIQWQVVNGLYGNSPEMEQLFPLPVPTVLPRVGTGHDQPPAGGYASASWLREQAAAKGLAAWQGWVPDACLPLYLKAEKDGALLDTTRYETILLGRLRGMTAQDFARFPGAGEGLDARLAAAAKQATSLEELYALAKTKRFAHSRVRRLALAAALKLPPRSSAIPPFAQILAANGRGLTLLKTIKKKALLPVSTSLAKLAATGDTAAAIVATEAAAEDLHSLCLKAPQPGGGAFRQPAAIVAKTKL